MHTVGGQSVRLSCNAACMTLRYTQQPSNTLPSKVRPPVDTELTKCMNKLSVDNYISISPDRRSEVGVEWYIQGKVVGCFFRTT